LCLQSCHISPKNSLSSSFGKPFHISTVFHLQFFLNPLNFWWFWFLLDSQNWRVREDFSMCHSHKICQFDCHLWSSRVNCPLVHWLLSFSPLQKLSFWDLLLYFPCIINSLLDSVLRLQPAVISGILKPNKNFLMTTHLLLIPLLFFIPQESFLKSVSLLSPVFSMETPSLNLWFRDRLPLKCFGQGQYWTLWCYLSLVSY
jgi:hypothetical protein